MKWMRVASIIGIFFVLVLFITFIFSLVSFFSETKIADYSQPANGDNSIITFLIILFVVTILLFFFFFGFIKVAEKSQKNFLRISTWIFVSGIIFFSLVFALFVISYSPDSNEDSYGDDYLLNYSSYNLSSLEDQQNYFLTGNAIGSANEVFSASRTFLFLFILSILVLLVGYNLFYIGLIEFHNLIPFARKGAIFGFLFLSSWIISLCVSILFFILFFFTSDSSKTLFFLITNIPYILGLLSLIFLTLFLWKAGDKYEGDGVEIIQNPK